MRHPRRRRRFALCLAVGVLAVLPACASLGQLGQLVQPPRFSEARDQPGEIRLLPPRAGLPLGGAGLRVWTRVANPNPFGLTLTTLRADIVVEGARAASGEFPLGLPLAAGGETVVPIDLSLSFADLPGLADAIRRAATGQPLGYEVDGTIGVDAGRLGTPAFGPMRLWRGEIRVPR
jgi:hypothetical protein